MSLQPGSDELHQHEILQVACVLAALVLTRQRLSVTLGLVFVLLRIAMLRFPTEYLALKEMLAAAFAPREQLDHIALISLVMAILAVAICASRRVAPSTRASHRAA